MNSRVHQVKTEIEKAINILSSEIERYLSRHGNDKSDYLLNLLLQRERKRGIVQALECYLSAMSKI